MTAPVQQCPWEVDQSSVWKPSNPSWDGTRLEGYLSQEGNKGKYVSPSYPNSRVANKDEGGNTVIITLGGIDSDRAKNEERRQRIS